jgi:hypothetical protein
MTKSQAAKALGRLGGLARRKKLSTKRRQEIARQGAEARKESFRLARTIVQNFNYVVAIRELWPPGPVISTSTCTGPLPGIYA